MKALSVQVQPGRASEIDIGVLESVFTRLAQMKHLVLRHQFEHGHDKGEYFNFTFGTEDLATLWATIQGVVYGDPALRGPMEVASIASCEGSHGWDDYLLLYHFDATVKRDAL